MKKRDRFTKANNCSYSGTGTNGEPLFSQTINYDTTRSVGSLEYYDGTDSGSFLPNTFRITPVTLYKQVGYASTGLIAYKRDSYPKMIYTLTGPYGTYGWTRPTATWDTNLANWSKTKALAKIGSAELDLGQILIELDETLKTMMNPFKSMLDMSRLPRGNKNPNKRLLGGADYAANNWLSYYYGIRPLIEDIDNIIDQFNAKAKRISKARIFSKRASKSVETFDTSTSIINLIGAKLERTVNTRKTIKSTTILYFNREIDFHTTWQERFGLDLNSLPAMIWERVSYSFVLDWFANVNLFLQAIKPTLDISFLGACTSQVTTTDITVTYTKAEAPVGWSFSGFSSSKVEFREKKLIRVIENDVSPVLAYNPTPFKNLERTISAVSLLWGQSRNTLLRSYRHV